MTLSDYDGRTALHLSAAEGHLPCVEFLLVHCNVPHDPHDRWGSTPLNEASIFGHTNVVDFLKIWTEQHPKEEVADKSSVNEILIIHDADSEEVKKRHFLQHSASHNPPFENGTKPEPEKKDNSIVDIK